MNILNLIASDKFIVVNKDLVHELGLEEAILIGELATEHNYWKQQGKLDDGYFYSTLDNVSKNTTLSPHKQRQALKHLQSLNIVDVKSKGLPARRYIKINVENLENVFDNQMLKNEQKMLKNEQKMLKNEQKMLKNEQQNAEKAHNHQMLKNLTTRCSNFEELDVKNFNNQTLKNLTTRCSNFEELDVKNFNTNNNNINNNNIKIINNNNKQEKEKEKDGAGRTSGASRTCMSDYDLVINANITDNAVKDALHEFIKMRKTIKKPPTVRALELIIKRLQHMASDSETQLKILEQSIMNSWQNIYSLENANKCDYRGKNSNTNTNDKDDDELPDWFVSF